MQPSPVRLIICGAAGFIGRRHVERAVISSQINLVAIVDPTPAGKELGQKINVPCYDNVEEILADQDNLRVEAALVATPSATHVPVGTVLLRAGIHCLIEKPISVDSESAKEILQASRESGARVMIGHHRRMNPLIMMAKTAIDSGKLGQILACTGVWAARKPDDYYNLTWRQLYKSGGPLLTNMIHEVDIVRHLLGDIKRVYVEQGARTRGYEVEETLAITLSFASGAVGTYLVSDAALTPWTWEQATDENPEFPYTGQNVYQIMGTKGALSMPDLLRWHKDKKPDGKSGDWFDPLDTSRDDACTMKRENPYPLQMQRLVDLCRGKEEAPCSAEDAIRALQLVEAMFESMETMRPVDVDLSPL